jgi:hypothetical protein
MFMPYKKHIGRIYKRLLAMWPIKDYDGPNRELRLRNDASSPMVGNPLRVGTNG